MSSPPEHLADGSLVLDGAVPLPAVLDVLVVGGGPAGTAVAFRAKELGLAVLVIEHDDILKRIRDYDRMKMIRPDFGAGKQMGFPVGDALIAQLQFEDVSPDVMHVGWRSLYRRHSVPARVGVEFTGLERRDAHWCARVRNHHQQQDETILARHVVLAIGGGMPRTLDIPGNVAAIATRLGGADRFVGGPACVIGGGTAAAEAVIAISKAKTAAGDADAVYWAHRGEKMPLVSDVLAPEIFQAVNMNGNLRYLPNSEPVAVSPGPDGVDYLRLQVDRRSLPNRPVETVHLEFRASHCLACIGQELPTRLLGSFGISATTGGPRNRSGFVLSPLFETSLPNLYMVGDTLNTAYHECQTFGEDPTVFAERSHLGNIKRALTDGVIVADVIAQRLAGRTQIEVRVESTPSRVAASPAVLVAPHAPTPAPIVPPPMVTPDIPERPAVRPGAAPRRTRRPAALVRLLNGGVQAEQFVLRADGATTLGRNDGDVRFKEDTAMGDRHLSIVGGPSGYIIGESSKAGAFLSLHEDRPRELPPGAVVNVGEQWLVFGGAGDPLVVTHHDAGGAVVSRFRLRDGAFAIGRDAPDFTLSPRDLSLSRRHVSLTVTGQRVVIRDLKSANGTFVELVPGTPLEDGDELRLGHQTLRFVYLEEAPASTLIRFDASRVRPVSPPVSGPAGLGADAKPIVAPSTGPAVTFREAGKTCPVTPGQSICEVAELNGVDFSAECHAGLCGSDPVRILAGEDNLNLMSDDERSTLLGLCRLDPLRHRLACVARPTGPVVISFKIEGS